jgi:carbonic anhydrase/acetyltransferase-like protein (isoleucine patch superfamily)
MLRSATPALEVRVEFQSCVSGRVGTRDRRLCGAARARLVEAGTILDEDAVVRSQQEALSIGIHSPALENSSVVGTNAHPVVIGQRTVFGHRCHVIGARIGNLCKIGNCSILMPGALLGDGCIRLNL